MNGGEAREDSEGDVLLSACGRSGVYVTTDGKCIWLEDDAKSWTLSGVAAYRGGSSDGSFMPWLLVRRSDIQ